MFLSEEAIRLNRYLHLGRHREMKWAVFPVQYVEQVASQGVRFAPVPAHIAIHHGLNLSI